MAMNTFLAAFWFAAQCVLSVLAAAEPQTCTDNNTYVEFDFSTLPRDGKGRYKLQITILTTDKDIKLSEPADLTREGNPEDTCAFIAFFLNNNKFKAEVVDKTKLRVYGRIFNDKLIPATEGSVTSPDLKKEELPKVKNPPKA
jgi:hypothetical protein